MDLVIVMLAADELVLQLGLQWKVVVVYELVDLKLEEWLSLPDSLLLRFLPSSDPLILGIALAATMDEIEHSEKTEIEWL